jgi:excisionase family DNA binding protein
MMATTFFIARRALGQEDSGQGVLCIARANDKQQYRFDVPKGCAKISMNSNTPAKESYSMIINDELVRQRNHPVPMLLLTVPEAGRALAISRSKIYDLLNSGDLPSVHIGRSRRVRMTDIEDFVNRSGARRESN